MTDGTALLGSPPGESVAIYLKELAAAEAIADTFANRLEAGGAIAVTAT